MRWLIWRFVAFLAPPRVILDRLGGVPYLSRWYLVGERPATNERGDVLEMEIRRTPNVYLHRFHRSDADGELHSHPWTWAIAIVLAGGYVEERRVGDRVVVRTRRPGSVNVLRGDDYHRVELLQGDSWTLFIAGPKLTTWFFWNRERRARAEWKRFLAWRRGELTGPGWEADTRGAS